MTSRNKIIASLSIIIFLLIAGLGYLYWFQFLPMQEQISSLKSAIRNEETLLSQIEDNQQKGEDGEIIKQTAGLQKKLPVAPLLDQFILDLERAEVSSGSLITSFAFNDNNSIPEKRTLEETAAQNDEGSLITESNPGEANGAASDNASYPEGVEKLTVSMVVEAPSYFGLEAFIKEIEEMPRITKIDQLSFTGNKEVQEAEVLITKLVYSITVSTFYYPKLVELKDQLPEYSQPPPANKANPLYPFPKQENSGG